MSQRIHAVLDPTFDSDPVRKARLREFVLTRFRLRNLNEARYQSLGVLSGDVEPEVVEQIRHVEGLRSVSVDGVVFIS